MTAALGQAHRHASFSVKRTRRDGVFKMDDEVLPF